MRASFPLLALALLAPCIGAAQERRPDAELTLLRGPVEVLAPEARQAQPGQALERGQRVSTGAGGSAEVSFSDGARVRLGERGLLLIAGDAPGVRRGATDTTLQAGSVRAQVPAGASGAAPVVVIATPAARARLGEGTGILTVDEWQTTWAAVHRGAWRLTAAGKTVRVRDGYAVRVGLGRAPGSPQRLPAQPAWREAPQDGEAGALTVSWQPGAAPGAAPAGWRVEVARDDRFADVVLDRRLPLREDSLALADLPAGRYLLRVAAIDADLLEGAPLLSPSFVLTAARRPPVAQAPPAAPAQRPQPAAKAPPAAQEPVAQAAPRLKAFPDAPAASAPAAQAAQAPQAPQVAAPAEPVAVAAPPAPAAEGDAGDEDGEAQAAKADAKAEAAPGPDAGEGDEAPPRRRDRRAVAPELAVLGGLFLGNIGAGSIAGGVSVELGLRFRLPVGSLSLALRPGYEHGPLGDGQTRELLTLSAVVAWRLRAVEHGFVPYLLLGPQFHFDWLRGPGGADVETQPGLLAAAGAQFRVPGAGALFFEGGYRVASDPRRRAALLRGEVLSLGYRHLF